MKHELNIEYKGSKFEAYRKEDDEWTVLFWLNNGISGNFVCPKRWADTAVAQACLNLTKAY